jgi:hypothetical protein
MNYELTKAVLLDFARIRDGRSRLNLMGRSIPISYHFAVNYYSYFLSYSLSIPVLWNIDRDVCNDVYIP